MVPKDWNGISESKLSVLAERHPQSLLEGKKRRLAIAAIAATKPEVMLLDEPTVGQDYAELADIVGILNRLHKQTGNTMITITHDVHCARRFVIMRICRKMELLPKRVAAD